MIRDYLIPAVREAFSDKAFSFSTPPHPIIRLPSGCDQIGNLEIYDDGDEATVCLTEITHGHFNLYDSNLSQEEVDRRVTKDVISFLRELFSDHVLLFRGPSRGSGGWRLFRDVPNDRDFVGGREYFLWSGPFGKAPTR